MNYKQFLYAFAFVGLVSCTENKVSDTYKNEVKIALQNAKTNAKTFEKAFQQIPTEQAEGLSFLVANMPQRDLDSLTTEYLLENIDLAYKAKNEFAWARTLPDSIFYNDVLPYTSLNERRDNWRADFYKRFAPKVKDAKDIYEAILAVNQNIMDEVDVVYSTKRPKADQSPYESMECGLASCTGLSVLLTDAFRSVGIPARIAGTPNWTTKVGNHNWVEVYIDGEWKFTEYYYPGQFDDAWFLGDAGKANPNDPKNWIYASSFKKQPYHFPLVWDLSIEYVNAENVTDRYIKLFEAKEAKLAAEKDGKIPVHILLFKDQSCSPGDGRVVQELVVKVDGKEIARGNSAGPQEDMNKFFSFRIEQNAKFTVDFKDERGLTKTKSLKAAKVNEQFRLYVQEL
ncbi:transglutaminase-like domain-containing protein [Sediminitomix flava]|uniref:Transglutaminase superfamily protein n=1 Tax=Sediminitomix flava TaxID=379075 RepID=A0A315ZXP4_SEDFL|nr:transglutaminase-like domain-containing protein [Sediminitomix flava]PWJ42117.1 transglutaminase superfamily protein [Sediminitomix flava]